MAKSYIKKIVKDLKKKYKTNDPYQIAREKDIEIIYAPLNIWGMYKYINKNKVIFINSNLPEVIQNFVFVHELGHAVLHPKKQCFFFNESNYLSKIKNEYEANLFLAEFLIDDIDPYELNGYSLQQLSSKFKVPEEIIKLKFNKW